MTNAWRRLTSADVRRVPWRNGAGVTEVIAVGPSDAPPDGDAWDWRVSRARVAGDGPFSAYPGVERVLVVTEGEGLRLRRGDASPAVVVRPLEPHAFRGEDPVVATLLAGPVRDLNVFARRARCRAHLAVLAPGRAPCGLAAPAGHALLHVVAGGVLVHAEPADGAPAGPWRLEAGESLLGGPLPGPVGLRLSGDHASVAVVVCVVPVTADPPAA